MIMRVPHSVPLSLIVGVSPLNPRQQVDDADLDGLAASIRANGVIEDILVERKGIIGLPEDPDAGFLALDGSRRLRALRRLVEAGEIPADKSIDVVEIVGTEAAKSEIALAANFHRLGLHPVERYQAFARMILAGRTEAEIATHFRLDRLDVMRSLALGRDLAAEIRAAWKADEITADVAKAYLVTRDHAKQLEIFHALSGEARNDVAQIRRLLRGDAIIATHSLAVFAREEYLAAGGAIEAELFEEHSFFQNGPLLRTVAESKLRSIADRLKADQGWKWCATQFDAIAGDPSAYETIGSADYSQADKDRLAEIDAQDLEGCDDATYARLMDEADAIERRAWTRGVSAGARARLGCILKIEQDGKVTIEGGLLRAEDKPSPEMVAALDEAERQLDEQQAARSGEVAPPAVAPPAAAPTKERRALRPLMDAALSRALAECAAINVNLALALAVASMGSQGRSIATLIVGSGGVRKPHDLLDEIAGLSAPAALARCIAAPLGDLTTAFAALIARSINVVGFEPDDMGAIVCAVGQISDIGGALDSALDRKAYFEAAAKEAALGVIRECIGATAEQDARKFSAAKVADEAARVASDKKWLPAPWSAWLEAMPKPEPAAPAQDARSLAEAMAQAIDADEESQPARPKARHDEPRTDRLREQAAAVARFFAERTRRADGQRLKAADCHAAFLEWCIEKAIDDRPAISSFGNIAKNLGIERFRREDGVFYVNRMLTAAPVAAVAAE